MTLTEIAQLEAFFKQFCNTQGYTLPRRCFNCDWGKTGSCKHPLNPISKKDAYNEN